MKVELDKFKIMYWEVVHESNTIKRRWNTLIEQRDELEFTERLSKNGKSKITTNLVLAFGKTFTSGKVNLPVNVFLIPSKSSPTIGITVGFNGKRRIGE